jgi:membrane-associated phospholipid phosphatase
MKRLFSAFCFYLLFYFFNYLLVQIGVCLPLCLYLLQINDQLALWITMMMLITCIITQVFKRFVWRPRPWMLGRVQVISKTKTSAFPSRAVTISFVFGFIIALAINYSEGPRFDWHSDMIYLPLLFSVVSGIARIVLGAHYFSDCFFGVIAGATIVYISILLVPIHKGIITACPSCTTTVLSDSCYTSRKYAITATTLLSMANWKAFSLALTWIVAFCLFCIFDPLGFWSKSFQTLGTLLPCLLFHVTFLCPNHLGTVTSLGPRNPDGYKQFFVYALAASLIAFCMVFGIKVANKLYWPVRFVLLISYVVCVFFIIGFTRMLYA